MKKNAGEITHISSTARLFPPRPSPDVDDPAQHDPCDGLKQAALSRRPRMKERRRLQR